jgi:hypothetical protein
MYRYTTAVRHLASIRRYAKRAKVVLLDVDLHFLREMREADLRQDPAVRERAERVKQQELAVIRHVDYTMVHSTVERDVLAAECSTCPVAVFGWVADVVGTAMPYEARRDLLFVGGFQHPPNVDAVLHFAKNILPLIHRRLPEVRLHVVGSNPPASIRELESDAIVIEGFVPDLRPLFDHVRVAIAPLRFGAGVKGKVATAMAHGVPSVATRIAAEGMHLVPDRDILVADLAEEFADAVCAVYSEPARWNGLSTAGLAAVEREFSSARASAVISGVLDELDVAWCARGTSAASATTNCCLLRRKHADLTTPSAAAICRTPRRVRSDSQRLSIFPRYPGSPSPGSAGWSNRGVRREGLSPHEREIALRYTARQLPGETRHHQPVRSTRRSTRDEQFAHVRREHGRLEQARARTRRSQRSRDPRPRGAAMPGHGRRVRCASRGRASQRRRRGHRR